MLAFAIACISFVLPAVSASNGASFSHINITNGGGTIDLVNGGTARTYEMQKIEMNITMMNNDLGNPNATLYVELFQNGTLWYVSQPSEVAEGNTYTVFLSTTNVTGETLLNFRAELHWNNTSGNDSIVDTAQFNIQSVNLFFNNLSYAYNEVIIGSGSPSTLNLTVGNGGNDVMYNLTLTIVNPSGLQFSNSTLYLGDLQSNKNATGSLKITAPSSLNPGTVSVGVQLAFTDLSGVRHFAGTNIPINLNATLTTSYPLVTAAALVIILAIIAIFAILVIRRRSGLKHKT